MSRHTDRWLFLVGPSFVALAWFLLSVSGWVSPLLLPKPGVALSRLLELTLSGAIGPDIVGTGRRWLGGYAFGIVVGVPFGLLIGSSRVVYRSTEFVIEFFRALPVTALFPLFLLAFGIGDTSKLAMVFTATFFIAILNSSYGVSHATEARARMALAFGATRTQVFRTITFFEAAPQILVGMRTALSISLIVIVLAEMQIGADKGLGQRLFDAYSRNATPDLYAVMLVLGVIGYVSNRLFVLAERRLVFWAGR